MVSQREHRSSALSFPVTIKWPFDCSCDEWGKGPTFFKQIRRRCHNFFYIYIHKIISAKLFTKSIYNFPLAFERLRPGLCNNCVRGCGSHLKNLRAKSLTRDAEAWNSSEITSTHRQEREQSAPLKIKSSPLSSTQQQQSHTLFSSV